MKLIATAWVALVMGGLFGTDASAQDMPTKPGSEPGVITISCFRGPTVDVIWDRPNAVFIEDLVRLGYTYPEAHSIGERICRDEYGVRDSGHMKSSLLEILRKSPPKS